MRKFLPIPLHYRADVPVPRREQALESQYGLTSVTTGKTLTSLYSALVSADSSMNTRSDDMSAFSVLATAVPASVVSSISRSGIAYITPTAPPDWFSKDLPKDVQSVLLSRQSVLRSVETKILKIKSTGTSTGGVSRATGEVALGGLVAGAVVGVIAAL